MYSTPFYYRKAAALQKESKVMVNVLEQENEYEIHLVAPGLKKESFKLKAEGSVLDISYEAEEQKEDRGIKYLRKEFAARSFSRHFQLDDKIDLSVISASYVNGILSVRLPKKAEVAEKAKEIQVA